MKRQASLFARLPGAELTGLASLASWTFRNRPLEMHDIAQMKSLLPDLITFAYIDSELLRIHSAGAEAGSDAAAARAKKRQELDDEYERAARGAKEGEFLGEGKEVEKARKETVLLFKFNDGELKSSNGVGKVITRKFQ